MKDLESHQCSEIEKTIKCSFCEKKFRMHSERTRHEKSHSKEKPFSCGFCIVAFKDKRSLRMHLETWCKVKNRVSANQDMKQENSYSEGKPFKCDFCTNTFEFKQSLIWHLKRGCKMKNPDAAYRSEKPFQCDNCVASFTELKFFKIH